MKNKITPCLWFDNNGEEAITFYQSVFSDFKVGQTSRYGKGAPLPEGTLLTGTFYINGYEFMVLNGGPKFKFNESISFVIHCKNQEEIDHYWNRLSDGGQEQACGWLKDKFGVSWQIVPEQLGKLMSGTGRQSENVMKELFTMVKIDLATLQKAYDSK